MTTVSYYDEIMNLLRNKDISSIMRIVDTISIWKLFRIDPLSVRLLLPYYSQEETEDFMGMLLVYELYDKMITYSKYISVTNKYYISKVYNTYTDIDVILRDCNEFIMLNATNRCTFIINFKFDPMLFLSMRLIPTYVSSVLMSLLSIYRRYMNNISSNNNNNYIFSVDDTVRFFYGTTLLEELEKIKVWSMITLEEVKNEAKLANSIPIMYYSSHPHLLYNISKRPINDMSMYYNSFNSLTGVVSNNKLYVDNNEIYVIIDDFSKVNSVSEIIVDISNKYNNFDNIAIPVTRYALNVGSGLYHRQDPTENICGTFYYLELESSTYLICDKSKVLVARTKTDAAVKLLMNGYNDELSKILNQTYPNVETYEKGLLHEDLIYTPIEAVEELGYYGYNGKIDAYSIEQYPIYLGSIEPIELYATEDQYDQPLCTEARNQGYDIVVLTNMVGKFQVVTEILDTRDRYLSFSNLVYT